MNDIDLEMTLTLKWPWPWNDLDLENLFGNVFVSSNHSKKSLGSSFYDLRFASYEEKTVKCPQGILKWPWPWTHIYQKVRLVEFFQIVTGFIALSPTVWELLRKNLKNDLLCPRAMGQWPFTENFQPPLDAPSQALSFSPRFYAFISHSLGDIHEKPQIFAKIPDLAHFGPLQGPNGRSPGKVPWTFFVAYIV